MNGYVVTPAAFAAQMKALKDSGYTTVLPQQLYDYLLYNGPMPEKPVMVTFDDTREEHFTIGAAELIKQGFKGVFFIMTIAINRPNYMKAEQLKQLADEGHAVESHTWDHHMVTKYADEDWDKQLIGSKDKIEKITGKPVHYFAYPFGLWNKEAIPELKKRDYTMAFILSTKRDSTEPLHTVRRMIVPGNWTEAGMLKAMKTSFK
jgi:peptidoglycan/xylan/chitin deacetylase (PgdA/CDA1 family)